MISETDYFLGKNQNDSISAADIFLKRIFVIKINWKNVNNKNSTTQFVKKSEKNETGWDAYSQKVLMTIF